MARVPPRPPTAAEVVEVAVFAVDDERYAVETGHVRRVVRREGITPIPGAPEALAGVVNLRGEVLAVFDLRALVGLPRREVTATTHVVVLGADRDELGLVADAAVEVRHLRLDAIHAPPGSVEGPARQLLRGVTADALIVLDGAALLDDPRLFINQVDEAGPAPGEDRWPS
jgi:purine-binding chemotaxis protein CheW